MTINPVRPTVSFSSDLASIDAEIGTEIWVEAEQRSYKARPSYAAGGVAGPSDTTPIKWVPEGSQSVTTNALSASLANAIGVRAGFIDGAANPISYAMESTYLLEGTTLHNWYRDTRDSKIYYAFSNDRDSNIWTIGNGGVAISDTNTDLSGMEMPCVQKVGDVYYMIASLSYNLRLLSSTDKIHWSFADGGTPVLSKSSTSTDWNYQLFNPAFCVVGNEWYLLVESKTGTGNFVTHSSHATFTNGTVDFSTNASANAVLSGITGNACMVYVPDKSAILTVYGEVIAGKWTLQAATALLSSDLSLAASWVLATGFGLKVEGIHISDPTLVFSDGVSKSWKCLLGYNYDQSRGHNAYCQLSLNELYDAITSAQSIAAGRSRIGGVLEADAIELGHDGRARFIRNQAGFINLTSQVGTLEMVSGVSLNNATQISSAAGDLLLRVGATPGTLSTTYVVVKSTGYVGIGNSAPACPLEVTKGGGANQLVARFDNGSGNAYIELLGGSTKCVQLWTTGVGDFGLYTGATPGTLGTQRVFVDENGNVRIGGTGAVAASALVDVRSTTKGILFPRMTTTEKNAISTPAEGLCVYDLTTHKLCCYNGTAWQDVF